jgi:hypothetical protein
MRSAAIFLSLSQRVGIEMITSRTIAAASALIADRSMNAVQGEMRRYFH